MTLDYVSRPIYWDVTETYLANKKLENGLETSLSYSALERIADNLWVGKRSEEGESLEHD